MKYSDFVEYNSTQSQLSDLTSLKKHQIILSTFKFKATASDNVYGAGLTIKY